MVLVQVTTHRWYHHGPYVGVHLYGLDHCNVLDCWRCSPRHFGFDVLRGDFIVGRVSPASGQSADLLRWSNSSGQELGRMNGMNPAWCIQDEYGVYHPIDVEATARLYELLEEEEECQESPMQALRSVLTESATRSARLRKYQSPPRKSQPALSRRWNPPSRRVPRVA